MKSWCQILSEGILSWSLNFISNVFADWSRQRRIKKKMSHAHKTQCRINMAWLWCRPELGFHASWISDCISEYWYRLWLEWRWIFRSQASRLVFLNQCHLNTQCVFIYDNTSHVQFYFWNWYLTPTIFISTRSLSTSNLFCYITRNTYFGGH